MYAYLPMVGAPDLRLETVTTNSFNYLAFSQKWSALEAKTALALSNATALAAAPVANTNNTDGSAAFSSVATSPSGTNIRTGDNPSAANVYATTSRDDMTDTEKDARQPANFAFPAPTASDLLTVTPQMITQYLRPGENETNKLDRPGVVVFVPADMPFMPPTVKTTSESRAIYQSR